MGRVNGLDSPEQICCAAGSWDEADEERVFLPIGSNLPFFRLPIVTIGWIGICTFLFMFFVQVDLMQMRAWGDSVFSASLTYRWAVVPSEGFSVSKLISYQFVHASWAHLLANMWYLIVFGWILENAWGAAKFAGFVLVGGAVAVIPEIYVQGEFSQPIVGASGSAAFILGACAAMYPWAKIRMLFLLIPVPNTPSSFFIPLRYLIYFWLALQVSGLAAHFWVEPRPVAYTTHLTGFGIGLVVGLYFYWRRQEKFVDVDLSGRDLTQYYDALKNYQARQVEEANASVSQISQKHPWALNLQMQLYQLSLKFKQRHLAEDLFNQNVAGLVQNRRLKDLKASLDRFRESFGELPQLTRDGYEVMEARLSENPEFIGLLGQFKASQESSWRVRSLPQNPVK